MLKSDSDLLTRHDRRISWSFGAIVLILMIIVSGVAVSLSSILSQKQEDRLSGAIATILGESISRVSFSGKYHARLFVQEMKSRVPDLVFISVETRDGRILAHSDPTKDDTPMTDPADNGLRRQSIQSGTMITQERIHDGMAVKEVLIPYRSGIGSEVIGTVRIGINFSEARKEQRTNIYRLLLLIGILTTMAIWGIYILSHRFGRTVRMLAMQLQGILNHAPLAISITDKSGRVPAFSVVYEDTFGCPAKDGTQQQLLKECLSESDVKELAEADQIVFESGMPGEREIVVDLHGDSRFWNISKFPIAKNEKGRATLICTFIHDITDRKRAEVALRESEERYRNFVKNATEGIYRVDFVPPVPLNLPERELIQRLTQNSIVGEVNEHLARMYGLSISDMLGHRATEFAPDYGERALLAVRAPHFQVKGQETQDVDSAGHPVFLIESFTGVAEDGRLTSIWGVQRDITDRKHAEEALKESEAKFRTLHQTMMDAFVNVDMEGRIIDCNDSYLNLLGYTPEEIGKLSYKDVTPEKWHTLEAAIIENQVLPNGYSGIYEKEYRRKDGAVVPVELRTTLMRDANGSPIGMWAIIRNISERKKAEEALKASESRFREMFAQNPLSIQIIDHNGFTLHVNEAHTKLFGSVPPSGYSVFSDPVVERQGLSGLWEHVRRGEIVKFPDFYYNPHDMNPELPASPVWLQMTIFPLPDSNGNTRYVLMHNNITERKKAEEALRENEELFRATFEQTSIGIAHVSSDGRWLRVNQKLCDIVGYTAEELASKTFQEITHPEDLDGDLEQVKKMLSGEIKTYSMEKRYYRKDSSIVWVNLTVALVRETGGAPKYFISIIEDITERKRAEEKRRELEDKLQRSEKMEALGTLAGGVAHDLNNMLGIIVGYSELLSSSIEKSSPLQSKVANIMKGGERAAAVVQDLLTLARRGVQTRSPVNINSVIKNFLKAPEYEKILSYNPRIKVNADLQADILNIMGSQIHLHKTVMNLVSNASEAMPNGGCLNIKTSNQYLDRAIRGYDDVREGEYVVLSISDTGEGISSDNIRHIFEPFYTKKVMGRSGTGLGLAVVWGTVKDHDGYIDVQSEEGKGTTFNLYFPVTREEISDSKVSLSLSEYMGKGESVLVVDDVGEQRDLASEMLSRLDYTVTTVPSGEAAVEYLKTKTVDILVLDMIMDPGMDGLDAYKEILKLCPGQKAIIVSGFSETDRVREAQKLGAGAYVRKPYVLERLGLAVRRELDK